MRIEVLSGYKQYLEKVDCLRKGESKYGLSTSIGHYASI